MLKPCFSYFGSKRKVATIIWGAFGEVSNFVDPFCGSLSVLFANPKIPKIETVNDIDCGLTNFYRAIANDSEGVAKYADNPTNELDLHARHQWLISKLDDDFRKKIESEPDFFDIKAAGFWCFGQSISIGNNWLKPKGLKSLPVLSSAGAGINGLTYNIQEDFKKIQQRLRKVRVVCGDWSRIVTPSVTYNNVGIGAKDITGVLLDPPYSHFERDKVYREDKDIYKDVYQWAIDNDDNPRMRIALCGYKNDEIFPMPSSWKEYNWCASGGLAALGDSRGKENAKKETIWFNQYCL